MEIRKIIYTTNAIKALYGQFRKVTKTIGSFPKNMSLMKMLYLAAVMELYGGRIIGLGYSSVMK